MDAQTKAERLKLIRKVGEKHLNWATEPEGRRVRDIEAEQVVAGMETFQEFRTAKRHTSDALTSDEA